MRLSEFDYKHHRNLVDQLMSKNGYKKLGQGAESVVYEKDAGNAIKIIIPESGEQYGGNQAHESFLEFCRAHKDNPHLPRFVEGQTPLVIDGEEFKQIVMEKLQPVKDPVVREILEILAGDDEHGSSYNRFSTWDQVLKNELDPYLKNGWFSDKVQEILKTQPLPTDKFANFFTIAKELFRYNRQYQWDLHADNVMQRADGTLVIIDPWVG